MVYGIVFSLTICRRQTNTVALVIVRSAVHSTWLQNYRFAFSVFIRAFISVIICFVTFQKFRSSSIHSFAGSMPSKNFIAKPCSFNSFFSFLRQAPSAPTKAARIKRLPGLVSVSAIYEISSSVTTVSSRTNVIYPGEDGRRNISASARSF